MGCAGRTRSCPDLPSGPRGHCRAACSACSRSRRSRGRAGGCRASSCARCTPTRRPRSSRPAGSPSTARGAGPSRAWAPPPRVGDCSRRSPVTQASRPSSARSSAATLRIAAAVLARPRPSVGACSSITSTFDADALLRAGATWRSVSSNSRSGVEGEEARDGSISSSMSMITDSSFWKEHATYRRGWWSSRYCEDLLGARAPRLIPPAWPGAEGGLLRQTAHSPSPRTTSVELVALPVDEEVHVLEVELHRQRQILDLLGEARRADALDEGVELLALVALGLVVAQPALDGVGHALGGQARLQPRAHHHLAAVVVAADVRDVRRHGLVADLDRRAVEADVRDVVLAAAVGAAAVLDVDLARERVLDVHLLELLVDRLVQAHRAGDAELAAVGAGAAHVVGDLVGAGVAEAELAEPLPDVVDATRRAPSAAPGSARTVVRA